MWIMLSLLCIFGLDSLLPPEVKRKNNIVFLIFSSVISDQDSASCCSVEGSSPVRLDNK